MSRSRDGAIPQGQSGHRAGPAPVLQWVGMLLAPAAFLVHLQTGYLLTIGACDVSRSGAWIHAAALAAVILAATGTWAARITWLRAGETVCGDEATPAARARLLGGAGQTVSTVLTLVLLAQLAAGFVVPRCQ